MMIALFWALLAMFYWGMAAAAVILGDSDWWFSALSALITASWVHR